MVNHQTFHQPLSLSASLASRTVDSRKCSISISACTAANAHHCGGGAGKTEQLSPDAKAERRRRRRRRKQQKKKGKKQRRLEQERRRRRKEMQRLKRRFMGMGRNRGKKRAAREIQMCQKGRRMGCVITRCKLQCGITQPILRLFLTYLYVVQVQGVPHAREPWLC